MVSAYAKNDPEIVKRWEANGLLIWKREPVVEVTIEPAAKVEETATAESNT